VFTTWQVRNHFTSVNRIFARGNEIRSSGTWSCTFKIPAVVPQTTKVAIRGS
jgi:hypothetical protein